MGLAKVRPKPYELAKRTYAGVGTTMLATTPPFRQPIRSASTALGTPPIASKQRAIISKVVEAVSSLAKRTKRQREWAITAQKVCNPSSLPQSMTSTSPGAQVPGRRPRWWPALQSRLTLATRRRKLCAEPS